MLTLLMPLLKKKLLDIARLKLISKTVKEKSQRRVERANICSCKE
jgi:hypothetical protein